MISRTFDPAFLNSVCNHLEVRPYLEGEGVLDLTGIAVNPDNFLLETEFGGFALVQLEPGRYDVHSMFLPGNGTHPVKAMRAGQEYMFTRTNCRAITSKVPDTNDRAKGFAVAGGLTERFRSKVASFVEISVFDWALRTAKCRAEGEKFHEFLEAAKEKAGSPLPAHEDDPVHNHIVGAAYLMMQRGQPEKGVALYNRWAVQAGYALIEIIQLSPLAVNVVDAVIGMEDQEMRILLCR